jgi:hypothetical protein
LKAKSRESENRETNACPFNQIKMKAGEDFVLSRFACLSLMLAAFSGVLMLVADGAGGNQLTAEILLHSGCGVSLNAYDDFHAPLVEDVHGAAAHAAGNDHLRAVIRQKIGQESGAVARIGHRSLGGDGTVGSIEKDEVFTMAEMAGNGVAHGCDCNFHNQDLL